MSETDLVRAAIDYLHLRGFLVWRQNQGAIRAEYKGKRRFYRFAGITGISDIIGVCPDGRFFAGEAKIKPNRPSLDQTLFLEQVRNLGGMAVLFYDLTDLQEAIEASLQL